MINTPTCAHHRRTAFSRLVVLLLGAGALGACDQTHFQSPPAATLQACDPHFVGTWLVLDSGPPSYSCKDHEICDLFVVGQNCSHPHVVERDGEQREESDALEKGTEVAFADLRGRKLLSLSIDLDSGDWRRAYTYYRYEIAGDTIRVFDVDSTRVARLIKLAQFQVIPRRSCTQGAAAKSAPEPSP